MVPDIDLQLQVVLKALDQAVRPSLDPADRVAAEQLGLAMATLAMVRSHLPIQRTFVRRMLEDALRIAHGIDGDEVLRSSVTAAEAILLDPEAEATAIEDCRSRLNGEVSRWIAAQGEGGLAGARSIVVTGSRKPVERMRAWFGGAGFEPAGSGLAPIETLLAPPGANGAA